MITYGIVMRSTEIILHETPPPILPRLSTIWTLSDFFHHTVFSSDLD